jgi:hypothetical protein
MTAATYARLRATDPARWREGAAAWRAWAALAGRWSAEFDPVLARLRHAWSGAAATAAFGRLRRLRQALDLFRLLCWEADQALSEFAAALERARTLLSRAATAAAQAGLVITDDGSVTTASRRPADAGKQRRADQAGVGRPAAHTAADHASAELCAALRLAAEADAAAAGRLTDVAAAAAATDDAPAPPTVLPSCTATPREVRVWWGTLTPQQRRWLTATEPGWLGQLDGVPAAFRDLANRLLLDRRRAELDEAASAARGGELRRVEGLRHGLGALAARLAADAVPRAYLLRLDLAGEGRAVVALGDPDRADNILTQVPGMTADLASYHGELARAERIAVRAAQMSPSATTSAVMWLDYDAPDFVDEAAGASRAEAGAGGLRRFQDGLRATHHGAPAHQTVLGHSYGSLVVGKAAAGPGLDADSVIFVGSPGVGVDSAAQLRVPRGQIWSTTSRSDIIQYAAVAPRSVIADVVTAGTMPVIWPAVAFATPEDDLWFGRNPSDPAFGARVFASQPDAGHLGYWDPGRPALDAITSITLGTAR